MSPGMKTYQVVVVGGGATGSAVLRDLAMRGIKAALVDRGDLCSGTSARFHGLLHSGGRYAVSDPGAARECITENKILKKIASPWVNECGGHFIQMVGDDPGYVDRWIRACREAGIRVRERDPDLVLKEEPALRKDLERVFLVPDGAVDGFGLVYASARAACAMGADLYTYTRVRKIVRSGDQVSGLELENVFTGEISRLACDIVVNAAGAFAGEVAFLAGLTLEMKPNRGTMVVFNHRIAGKVLNRLRPPGDGDIIVPHHTTTILGTTSVEVEKPDDCRPSPEEVDRLLAAGAEMIARVDGYRLLRAYAGIRPLASAGAAKGRQASRGFLLIDHQEDDGLEGLVTITGGKFTTCRLMAEKTCDLVAKKLGRCTPCRTAGEKVVKAKGSEVRRVRKLFPGALAEPLLKRAAGNLKGVLAGLEKNGPGRDIVCECEGVSAAEVTAVCRGLPLHSLGEVQRRTRLGSGTCQGIFCSYRVAGLLVEEGLLLPRRFHSLLGEFLQKRWRGQRVVQRGSQLAEAELALGIYSSLLCMERFDDGGAV